MASKSEWPPALCLPITTLRTNNNGNTSTTSSSRATSRSRAKGIVVFSGGSAANNLVDVFNDVADSNQCSLSYVIPISDNGGSSSELIRVFGGPGIGDVRSRLVRLIPDTENPHSETAAIKSFFNYRLPSTCSEARREWLDIVEAVHPLWTHISSPKRELIRSFLNAVNLEIVKRLRPSSRFDFSGASIGNLFLTGHISVLPALNTNFAHHISAGLADGTTITGQNNISHPSIPTIVPGIPASPDPNGTLFATDPSGVQLSLNPYEESALLSNVQSQEDRLRTEIEETDKVEDANLPGTLPTLRKPAIKFSKADEEDLPARIKRLWYINPYGQEIRIPANPRVIATIENSSCIIYSIGSLFTSIVPSLILKGVGEAIASPSIRTKILILNGTTDRETGPSSQPFSATDFVAAIANACVDSRGFVRPCPSDEYWHYVTHIVYLEGPSSPKVNKTELNRLGIETMRLYGRKGEDGKSGRYDAKALTQALEAVIGKADPRADRTRRNTVDGRG
ncbi:hypothetical protein LTR66_005111 [Elasticomyces elasticus]|nr:hypothetical protein LTR66_005111 [Elasticomyces elasticus]